MPTDSAFDAKEARVWLELLLANLKQLKEMTEKYPVYLLFEKRGFIFRSERDIDDLITKLLQELAGMGEDVSGYQSRLQSA